MKKIFLLLFSIWLFFKKTVPSLMSECIFLLAFSSVFYGLWCIYEPCAFIVCGIFVMWFLIPIKGGK